MFHVTLTLKRRMRRICVLLMLFGCAEETIENEVAQTVGNWAITWTVEDESVTGNISLDRDHTGNITVNHSEPSVLLQGNYDVDVIWERNKNALQLTRSDNAFELNYTVVAETDSTMQLVLFDEIYATMQRTR